VQHYTQDEAIAYECAREAITHLLAVLTEQITEEAAKTNPNAALVAALRDERSRLFNERKNLHVEDHVAIARIRTEYGTRIRSWNEQFETRRHLHLEDPATIA